jgi:hypothetical protein
VLYKSQRCNRNGQMQTNPCSLHKVQSRTLSCPPRIALPSKFGTKPLPQAPASVMRMGILMLRMVLLRIIKNYWCLELMLRVPIDYNGFAR